MLRRSTATAAFVLTIILTATSCRDHTANPSWSYDRNIGFAFVNAEHACLAITNPSLPANTHAYVIDPQRQREMAAVVASERRSCDTGALEYLRLVQPGSIPATGYELRLDAAALETPFVGIVVIGEGIAFVKREGQLTGDLDRDGRDEFFRSCPSTEGVHGTIWSDAPLTGTRRWHGYYSLGYDVEPHCTPAEVVP